MVLGRGLCQLATQMVVVVVVAVLSIILATMMEVMKVMSGEVKVILSHNRHQHLSSAYNMKLEGFQFLFRWISYFFSNFVLEVSTITSGAKMRRVLYGKNA